MESKAVLITGAAQNTGYAIAEKFACEGYHVAITSREEATAQQAAKALAASYPGIRTQGIGMALSDVGSIRAGFARLAQPFARLNAFIGSAANQGIGLSIFSTTPEAYDAVLDANLRGHFFCCQEAIRRMPGGGSLLLISSVHAQKSVTARLPYAISKAGIGGMVRSLALELGHLNIRANALLCGAIWTRRWEGQTQEQTDARRARYPIGRESSQVEIANAAYFLASDLSPTITGTEMTIDSGISACLLPYDREWSNG